jgi:hypothetical protein
LRDQHGRGLLMRGEGCELRSREGGGGKQHEAKFCHDNLRSPGKNLEQQTKVLVGRSVGATINS